MRLLTSASGQEVGALSYSPFGQLTGESGQACTALGYDGQYTDPGTGYIYLRARYYDPGTGQFLTRDPEDALTGSPYAYAGNDPANAIDPLGLSWWNPFSWSKKTWEAIGIGVGLPIGAVLTDGADLSLLSLASVGADDALEVGADEAFGIEAGETADTTEGDVLASDDTAETEQPAEYRHYTRKLNAEQIEIDKKINPSSDGKIYVTPDQYATGQEAQEKLSLKYTPQGYYVIPADVVINPSVGSEVAPHYDQPGGGNEVSSGSPINADGLKFIPLAVEETEEE